MEQTSRRAGGHERTDVKVRPIVIFGIVLAIVTTVAAVVVKVLHRAFEAQAARHDVPIHPLAEQREIPPGPQLQEKVGAALEVERREQQRLQSYGWVDRQQ